MSMKKGFTLLEVMIALAIMTGTIVVVASTWGSNFSRIKNIKVKTQMNILLKQAMLEAKIKYEKDLESLPPEEQGEFEGLQGYSWEIESQDFPTIDLAPLLVSDGEADQMTLTIVKQLTQFLAKSVKEVKVTVIYTKKIKKKAKPRLVKISATTYFVNYDNSIDLGSLGGLPQ